MNSEAFRKTSHPRSKEEGQGWEWTETNDTLNAFDNGESRTPTVVVDMGGGKSQCGVTKDVTPTLATTHGGEPVVLENHPNDSRVKIREDGTFQTLSSRMGTGGGNVPMVENKAVVRRLTPLECERLQGFPDGWTDIGDWEDSKGKKHKGDADSPRYKALGNSIALPFWEWMAERMVKQLREDGVYKPTMASLFSGIGGFELSFARAGAVPVWNSEIEPFPDAVTTKHFGDDEKGIKGDYEQYL